MTKIQQNIQLQPFTTFGVRAIARRFIEFDDTDRLVEFIRLEKAGTDKFVILNGGSNILFTGDYEGLVIRINTQGIRRLKEDKDHVWVQACAGVNWHEFVTYCIDYGFGGLENLSLIPGNVGAAPVQNIGAYGVEQKDVFDELEAINIQTGEIREFGKRECRFGYRNSIFKKEERGKWIILRVIYKLLKQPAYNVTYGAIRSELEKMGVTQLSVKAVGEAVCNIRRSKLPDVEITGNAGSFFKNPVVSVKKYQDLKERYPDLVAFEADGGRMKLAAGWLIDQLGWKGFREGDAGVWKSQALVLVNYGNATGAEILQLAEKIRRSVKTEFGISLEPEVNIH